MLPKSSTKKYHKKIFLPFFTFLARRSLYSLFDLLVLPTNLRVSCFSGKQTFVATTVDPPKLQLSQNIGGEGTIMADLTAFSNRTFETTNWINHTLRDRPEEEHLESYLASIAMKLHIISQDYTDQLETGTTSVSNMWSLPSPTFSDP